MGFSGTEQNPPPGPKSIDGPPGDCSAPNGTPIDTRSVSGLERGRDRWRRRHSPCGTAGYPIGEVRGGGPDRHLLSAYSRALISWNHGLTPFRSKLEDKPFKGGMCSDPLLSPSDHVPRRSLPHACHSVTTQRIKGRRVSREGPRPGVGTHGDRPRRAGRAGRRAHPSAGRAGFRHRPPNGRLRSHVEKQVLRRGPRRRLGRETEVGQNFPDDHRILDGRDHSHPPATTGAREDIDGERVAEKVRLGRRLRHLRVPARPSRPERQRIDLRMGSGSATTVISLRSSPADGPAMSTPIFGPFRAAEVQPLVKPFRERRKM
jgi:hypothetical protein